MADTALVDYWCTALKCVVERKLDTGDAAQDYAIVPTDSATPDTLEVRAGQARLFINESSYSTGLTNPDAISISVYRSAMSVAASVGAVIGAAMLTF